MTVALTNSSMHAAIAVLTAAANAQAETRVRGLDLGAGDDVGARDAACAEVIREICRCAAETAADQQFQPEPLMSKLSESRIPFLDVSTHGAVVS